MASDGATGFGRQSSYGEPLLGSISGVVDDLTIGKGMVSLEEWLWLLRQRPMKNCSSCDDSENVISDPAPESNGIRQDCGMNAFLGSKLKDVNVGAGSDGDPVSLRMKKGSFRSERAASGLCGLCGVEYDQ